MARVKGADPSTETYANVGVDLLRPHPKNARQGDIKAICRSIEANGFFGAIVVQRSTSYILVGSHRWMAAKSLGMTEVPVVWVDVDDERALRIMLADNRTSDQAIYDEDALAELLAELADDLGGTGYDSEFLDQLLNESALFDVPSSKDDMYSKMRSSLLRIVVEIEAVGLVERALAKTGVANRAQAWAILAEAYLASED